MSIKATRDKFLKEVFKKDDTATVNANELQAELRQIDELKRELEKVSKEKENILAQNERLQLRIIGQNIELEQLRIDAIVGRPTYTVDLRG